VERQVEHPRGRVGSIGMDGSVKYDVVNVEVEEEKRRG